MTNNFNKVTAERIIMAKKTSIGGQALIEGIMMKGPYKTSMAVRKKDGSIDISEVSEKHLKDKYKFFGLPIIRGMVNLIEAMVTGYKTLMLSADISGFTDLEEDKEKKEASEDAIGSVIDVVADDTAENASADGIRDAGADSTENPDATEESDDTESSKPQGPVGLFSNGRID